MTSAKKKKSWNKSGFYIIFIIVFVISAFAFQRMIYTKLHNIDLAYNVAVQSNGQQDYHKWYDQYDVGKYMSLSAMYIQSYGDLWYLHWFFGLAVFGLGMVLACWSIESEQLVRGKK